MRSRSRSCCFCLPLLSPFHHPPPQLTPYRLLLSHTHPRRQPARRRGHEHPRPLPPIPGPHILALVLPPVVELLLLDGPPLPHPPHGLPDALPDQTDGLGPLRRDLGLQHGHPRVHLGPAQHARVPRRPLHDVRVPDAVQLREAVGVAGRVPDRGDPRGVE